MTVVKLKHRRTENLPERQIYERTIWDISDRDKSIKKTLEQWPDFLDNSRYIRIENQLYMLNDNLSLILDIRKEELEEKIEIIRFYPTDITYHYFRMDYSNFTHEKNMLGIAIKEPYQIFLDKKLIRDAKTE